MITLDFHTGTMPELVAELKAHMSRMGFNRDEVDKIQVLDEFQMAVHDCRCHDLAPEEIIKKAGTDE